VDSKEEDKEVAPQGDLPFPKWYTKLLDGVDVPNTSYKEVPLRRPRRLEVQHMVGLLGDVEEEPMVCKLKRIKE